MGQLFLNVFLLCGAFYGVHSDLNCKPPHSFPKLESDTKLTQRIERVENEVYTVTDSDGTTYYIGICKKPPELTTTEPDAGVVAVSKDKKELLIGKFSRTVGSSESDRYVTLVYKEGEKNTDCNNSRAAEIVIMCDPDAKTPIVSRPIGQVCSDVFVIATNDMCPSGRSGFVTFLLIVFILIAAYLVIGFLYKRFVLGAHGAEQIPNYLFWRQCIRIIQDTVSPSGGQDASERTYREARQDDFQYEQPTLSVPASRPDDDNLLGSDQYQPRSQIKDDSDERLLPV